MQYSFTVQRKIIQNLSWYFWFIKFDICCVAVSASVPMITTAFVDWKMIIRKERHITKALMIDKNEWSVSNENLFLWGKV